MNKNYYIYSLNGKIKRQAINLNEIYPESYALSKIPEDAEIFAMIVTSDVTNKKWAGYRVKYMVSHWKYPKLWIDFYPDDSEIMLPDAILYHVAKFEFVKSHLSDVTSNERMLLQKSTEHAFHMANK